MRSHGLTGWSTLVSLCLAAALAACDASTSSTAGGASTGDVPPTDAGGVPGDTSRGGGDSGGSCIPDTCAATVVGVTWNCKTRFMYGANWAWRLFGADFGGVAAWNTPGVAGNAAEFSNALQQMKAAGVNVVRWWMFPRFFTDAITWNSAGAPAGIGGTIVADIHRALELADQQGVYLMLTLFSFDNFYPTQTEYGVYSRSLKPILEDDSLRHDLLENLVKPVAQAVESSPYRKRMIAWDIINEPEWAVSGTGLPGDAPFTPSSGLDTVSFTVMETFLKEATQVLHANSSALVSVGGAGIKWPKAWSRVGLDFYQFHYYDWLYEWFPYDQVTLVSVGVTDKPVVMGEFPAGGLDAIPSAGLPARSAAEFSQDLLAQGYAGALSWAYNDPSFPWYPDVVKSFADSRGCEVQY